MTRTEAVREIVRMSGGTPTGTAGTLYRFPDTDRADRCKAILDAVLPGSTGEVAGTGLLCVSVPDGWRPGIDHAAAFPAGHGG